MRLRLRRVPHVAGHLRDLRLEHVVHAWRRSAACAARRVALFSSRFAASPGARQFRSTRRSDSGAGGLGLDVPGLSVQEANAGVVLLALQLQAERMAAAIPKGCAAQGFFAHSPCIPGGSFQREPSFVKYLYVPRSRTLPFRDRFHAFGRARPPSGRHR